MNKLKTIEELIRDGFFSKLNLKNEIYYFFIFIKLLFSKY